MISLAEHCHASRNSKSASDNISLYASIAACYRCDMQWISVVGSTPGSATALCGDFTDPVTSATLSIVQVFWGMLLQYVGTWFHPH